MQRLQSIAPLETHKDTVLKKQASGIKHGRQHKNILLAEQQKSSQKPKRFVHVFEMTPNFPRAIM